MRRAYVNWSSGKDAALALYHARESGLFEIAAICTSVDMDTSCIPMHNVSLHLLKKQAQGLSLPLILLPIPKAEETSSYTTVLNALREDGVSAAIFGDLFLEELRRYREERLSGSGIYAEFPLWGMTSVQAAREFIHLGFQAVVTCVDADYLAPHFVGRYFDEAFLAELPPGVDPCGENGEFHTFVFDGPIFHSPIPFCLGDLVCRDYDGHKFWYQELR